MRVYLAVCVVATALAFDAMPKAYWQNLGHGVNARSVYRPGIQPKWQSSMTKMNCSLPTLSVPFDFLSTYGPAGVNPVDGSIVVGLKCSVGGAMLPYLWISSQTSKAQKFIQLSSVSCTAQFRDADVFEGYLNFLPDGGVIFGMCGSVYVLPLRSNTVRNIGSYGYSPSILSVINSDPPQLIVAGGRWGRWEEHWGAVAVNIAGMTSETITMANATSITDTTIMFSPDGKTMYNGHFDEYAPGNDYGLQFWKPPFTSTSEPYALYSDCAGTRPWTHAADSQGNVYSPACGPLLVKVDRHGNQVWNISCPSTVLTHCDYVERQQVFMTDDEKYIYVGTTRYGNLFFDHYYNFGYYFVIDAESGEIVKTLNISALANEGQSCQTIYGPFASRWPLPLKGKTRAVFPCTINSTVTTMYSFDPFASGSGLKKYTSVQAWAPILLSDSSDNMYAIGIDSEQHAFVRRFPA